MRILHTMLRVGDLDKSINFYLNAFDMQLLRRQDYPSGKFTLAFIGYGSEAENTVIELTYNWDIEKYEKGTGFGHIALGTKDIYRACEVARAHGGKISREPGPMKFGGTTIIAFVEDPDGYKVELIQEE